MNELIEFYERKLKAIQPMIESAKYDEYTEREKRLRTKASCYRTFIAELKQKCNSVKCECCQGTGYVEGDDRDELEGCLTCNGRGTL